MKAIVFTKYGGPEALSLGSIGDIRWKGPGKPSAILEKGRLGERSSSR